MISRRGFLKLIASLPAASIPFAFSAERECYVELGTTVNYIGHHPGGFMGSKLVKAILPFDGVGFPVVLEETHWYYPAGVIDGRNFISQFYDFELSNLLKDVPMDFWHNPENCEKYLNVHTYVRVNRYGETVEEAVRHLNFYSSKV